MLGFMVECTLAELEQMVMDVLDALPERFARVLDDVAVVCLDEPPASVPDAYGVYDGPGYGYQDVVPQPSVIVIIRSLLCRDAADTADLREQVRITVLHEIGHHLGMDEEDLAAAGYA